MRKSDPESTLSSIWKSLTTPYINNLFQKAKSAYKNNKLEKALTIYTQILQTDPTNYAALCNRAGIKIEMKNFEKALFDIETAIEVHDIYDNIWYLSLTAHLSLQNMKKAEQDIKNINIVYYEYTIQETTFDVIYEFVNKLEHFDVKWFTLLVDSYPAKAMYKLKDIYQWKSLCNHQYGRDDYTRWYNGAVTWYHKYNNAPHNYKNTKAFFEKVYYMHKSKGCN